MPYEFYKVLHLTGIFLLISGMMAVFFVIWSGGVLQGKVKSVAFALHGLGLVFILVSGFGLLARLGMAQAMPVWVYYKMGIWAFFALGISVLKRKSQIGLPMYLALLGGYLLAAYIGVYKPA